MIQPEQLLSLTIFGIPLRNEIVLVFAVITICLLAYLRHLKMQRRGPKD